MDAVDREILALLSVEGRATMTEVAARVGLSLSACHRRVRDLQADGVIRGFRADLDLDRLGLPFEALVFVTMDRGDGATVTDFEEALAGIPEVIRARRLFGEPDYQLTVATASTQDYQRVYDEALSRLPGVRRLTSTLVMKSVVDHRAPIAPLAARARRAQSVR